MVSAPIICDTHSLSQLILTRPGMCYPTIAIAKNS